MNSCRTIAHSLSWALVKISAVIVAESRARAVGRLPIVTSSACVLCCSTLRIAASAHHVVGRYSTTVRRLQMD